jgi:hypothetical protein
MKPIKCVLAWLLLGLLLLPGVLRIFAVARVMSGVQSMLPVACTKQVLLGWWWWSILQFVGNFGFIFGFWFGASQQQRLHIRRSVSVMLPRRNATFSKNVVQSFVPI